MTKAENNKSQWTTAANLGIIGYGFVGQAVAYGFGQSDPGSQASILFYDKFKESTPLEEVIKQSEFIFICLPTPMKEDESGIDLGIIDEMMAKITPLTDQTDKIIVIKSTVVPGTTLRFEKKYPNSNFAFNPEFLTEANYLEDFVNANRTIVGANDDLVSRRVVALYRQRFPKQKIFKTDPTSAEMVKYMANAYLSMKVIFAYEMFGLCEELGIDYKTVKEMVTADSRIEDTHLNVEAKDTANSNTTDRKGFGGKCFPKDITALIGLARELAVDLSLLETVWEKNKRIRKVHDWEEIPFVVTRKSEN